eukprot:7233692-Pyramimonas_sp.AAC.1
MLASRGGPDGSPTAPGTVSWPPWGLSEACCYLSWSMLRYLERCGGPPWALGGPLGAISGYLGRLDRSRPP